MKNQWSASYDIKLYNDPSTYKILPEYDDCFNFVNFQKNSVKGQIVILGIDFDNGLRMNSIKSVISLTYQSRDYIDLTCVNDKIWSDKLYGPLTIIGLLSLFLFIHFVYIFYKYQKE